MGTQQILKKLREEKKLSTRELSRTFGMKEGGVSEIERGKRNLTVENLIKYCNYFHQPSDYILGLKSRISNIAFENEEIIIYNSEIYEDDFYNMRYKFKIKFKKKNWTCIKIICKIKYTYEIVENNFGYEEMERFIIYSSWDCFENDEEIDTILIDYKRFIETHLCEDYINLFRNVTVTILDAIETSSI
jgi:DNA-binding helix-turn-helix protein